MSDYAIQQILNAITLGSLYALVAIGFSLIYGVVRLVNFAHGDFLMLGAFLTLAISSNGFLPWYILAILILCAGFLLGVLLERGIFQFIRGAPMITGFVVTLSLSVAIQNLAMMIFGSQPRSVHLPSFFQGRTQLFGFEIQRIDLMIASLTIILSIAVICFVRFTKSGIAMRAVSENILAAQLMGVSISRAVLVAFGFGGSLAFLGGLFWSGKFGQIDPMMGFAPGLNAFVATIIGGVGSIHGAVLGGFILGFAEIAFVAFVPQEYTGFRDGFVFMLLILILIFMPQGLFGESEEERA